MQELSGLNTQPQKTPLALLRQGGSLRAARQWEFVPYNDSLAFPAPPQAFLVAVEAARVKLLNAANKVDRNVALDGLKQIYDQQFGNTTKERNGISLHLYGGPIGKTQTITSGE